MKTYVTMVLDDSRQSNRVMDVPGFSHFSQPFQLHQGVCRYAFIRGTNKTTIGAAVKKAIGDAFWSNLNFVELYDPQWHTHDKQSKS